MPCVFCRIRDGEIKSDMLYRDDSVFAIRDINPRAPTHLLIIPREHIPTVTDVKPGQQVLLGHMIEVASLLAKREGVSSKGYRLVINCGPDSGQDVDHLHLHLLGGRRLGGMA